MPYVKRHIKTHWSFWVAGSALNRGDSSKPNLGDCQPRSLGLIFGGLFPEMYNVSIQDNSDKSAALSLDPKRKMQMLQILVALQPVAEALGVFSLDTCHAAASDGKH